MQRSAETILREVGYEENIIDHVCSLVKKEGLKTDVRITGFGGCGCAGIYRKSFKRIYQ